MDKYLHNTKTIIVIAYTRLNLPKSVYEGPPVASFTQEVNPRLTKRPLVFNGRLANRGLTFLVKEATGVSDETACFGTKQMQRVTDTLTRVITLFGFRLYPVAY